MLQQPIPQDGMSPAPWLGPCSCTRAIPTCARCNVLRSLFAHSLFSSFVQTHWISQFGEDKWLVEHLFYNRRNGKSAVLLQVARVQNIGMHGTCSQRFYQRSPLPLFLASVLPINSLHDDVHLESRFLPRVWSYEWGPVEQHKVATRACRLEGAAR